MDQNRPKRIKSKRYNVSEKNNNIYPPEIKNNSRNFENKAIYLKHSTEKKSNSKIKKSNPIAVYKNNEIKHTQTNKSADNNIKSNNASFLDVNQSILNNNRTIKSIVFRWKSLYISN